MPCHFGLLVGLTFTFHFPQYTKCSSHSSHLLTMNQTNSDGILTISKFGSHSDLRTLVNLVNVGPLQHWHCKYSIYRSVYQIFLTKAYACFLWYIIFCCQQNVVFFLGKECEGTHVFIIEITKIWPGRLCLINFITNVVIFVLVDIS